MWSGEPAGSSEEHTGVLGTGGSHKRELSIGKEKREGPGAALIFGFWPGPAQESWREKREGNISFETLPDQGQSSRKEHEGFKGPIPLPYLLILALASLLKFTPIKTFPQS